MSIEGWQVTLSTGTYKTPSTCASCLGPRETEVKAQVSEKHGNIRTTLTMGFPYCNGCAKRVGSESTRAGLVIGGGVFLGLVLAVCAWFGDDFVDAWIGFGIAVVLAGAIAVGVALVTRPAIPPAPATARGEAVILLDTSGSVLCTNQRFADLLAQANGAAVKPGSKWWTTEAWAPAAAIFSVVFVLAFWAKYAPSVRTRPAPVVVTPAPARKPAPPPATTARPARTR